VPELGGGVTFQAYASERIFRGKVGIVSEDGALVMS